MSDNDWKPVVLRKTTQSSKPATSAAIAKARQEGKMETVSKVHHTAPVNARKLDDNESETFRHATIPTEFKLALQKARQGKNLTQAQLAQQLNLQVAIINSYESGKAIPDPQIIQKLNRALGVTLPKIQKPKAVKE
jgi:putative transcription factor